MGRKSLLFIVSAPSGAGKTSLCREVLSLLPDLHFSVSHTTRPPRQHERDGIDYYFVSPEEFKRMIESGQFVEWAEIYGNLYGTSRTSVEALKAKGVDIIFDIDHRGAKQIKTTYRDSITIFILPPSSQELEERLKQRGTDDASVITRRLTKAKEEMEQSSWYHYQIVNDDLTRAVEQLKEIITTERVKRIN
jgi:guanylate kinase